MTAHVGELLPDLLDERLPPAVRAEVAAHLGQCAECRAALADLREVWGVLSHALPSARPSPSVRDRLMADTAKGRLYHRAPALAEFFDLSHDDARALLDRAEDPTAWSGFPVAGVRYMSLRGGPRVAHRQNGLIHIPAGTLFPAHRHLGTETTLVLTGRFLDEDGSRFGAGAIVPRGPHTTHSFRAEGGVHLFCGLAFEDGACEWVDA